MRGREPSSCDTYEQYLLRKQPSHVCRRNNTGHEYRGLVQRMSFHTQEESRSLPAVARETPHKAALNGHEILEGKRIELSRKEKNRKCLPKQHWMQT